MKTKAIIITEAAKLSSVCFELLRLCRIYYGLPLAGGFLVIVLYLRGGTLAVMGNSPALAFLALLGTISAGFIGNDLCDIAVDKINSPQRPLASDRISAGAAKMAAITLTALALSCASVCGVKFAIGITAINLILLVYNKYSKQMALLKDLLIAALLAGLYPLAFALTPAIESPWLKILYIHPAWLFLTVLGYEMLKDIRDQQGDIQMGSSMRNICRAGYFLCMMRLCILTGSLITLLPVLLADLGGIYLTGSILAVILAVLAASTPNPRRAINYLYAQIALITTCSLLEILAS